MVESVCQRALDLFPVLAVVQYHQAVFESSLGELRMLSSRFQRLAQDAKGRRHLP